MAAVGANSVVTASLAAGAPNVFRDMSMIYVKASVFAVGAFVILLLTDSHFSFRHTLAFLVTISLMVPIYIVVDILVIRRHVAPLRRHFELEARGEVDVGVAVNALIRLLNLPWKTVMRVLMVHGPLAGLVGFITLIASSYWFDVEFSVIQSVFVIAFVMVFATPAHALFEYFAVTRYCEPLLARVWPYCEGHTEQITANVVQLGLKPKLIGLILFVSTIPIVFLATSIIANLAESVGGLHQVDSEVYVSMGTITMLCLVAGLSATLVMARQVASHVDEMLSVMNRVEVGDLNQQLTIVSADEYMQLYRGFNMMIEGLRSEIEMLEVTKDISGELQLDALLRRLMRATANLLGAERASVFLYDEKRDELWSRYAMEMGNDEIRFPASAGIAGHVLHSRKAVQVDDAYADPRFNSAVDKSTQFRTRNILCAPILNKAGKPVGVTQVVNKREGKFTERDLQRLAAFTAQVSVSLENAKLFDEVLQVKNYNENILSSASDAIITVDTEGVITKINKSGIRLLGGGQDPEGRNLRDLLDSNAGPIITAMMRVIYGGKSDDLMDVEFSTSGGNWISANVKVDALADKDGAAMGALLSFEDLSDEKRLKNSMSRYLSPEIVDQVISGGLDALGGHDQEVTVLFSDIRSFSTVSEVMTAADIVEMLNEYFTRMVDEVFECNGVLDKFIGDAIMAIYGTPFPMPDDPNDAVRSAINMLRQLDLLNEERVACGKPPIKMGIGINSGTAVVGNIGSPKRMEYTVIGDTVNLAARVEGLTKHYDVEIIVTESTRKRLADDIAVRELDRIAVKGKDKPDIIFEVIRPDGPSSMLRMAAAVERYHCGLGLLRQRRFIDAVEHFEALCRDLPDDEPSRIYLERAKQFRTFPPSPDWDGVWRFDTK